MAYLLPAVQVRVIYRLRRKGVRGEPRKGSMRHFNQQISELFGGDYWTRTSDLLRVKEFAENSLKPLHRS